MRRRLGSDWNGAGGRRRGGVTEIGLGEMQGCRAPDVPKAASNRNRFQSARMSLSHIVNKSGDPHCDRGRDRLL